MQRCVIAVLSGLLLAASVAWADDKPAAGHEGADRQTVATAQMLLRLLGIYSGTTNGTLGPQTRKALADYQQKLKLPVTGMPDRQTLYALGNPTAVAACVDAAMPMGDCLDNVAQMRRFLALGAPASAVKTSDGLRPGSSIMPGRKSVVGSDAAEEENR